MRIEVRPSFDKAVLAAERPVRLAAGKVVQLIESFRDLNQLGTHPGLNFKKLHGLFTPDTEEQLYSLRITRSVRATACLRAGQGLVLVSLYVQHDKTYRKR